MTNETNQKKKKKIEKHQKKEETKNCAKGIYSREEDVIKEGDSDKMTNEKGEP